MSRNPNKFLYGFIYGFTLGATLVAMGWLAIGTGLNAP
jgi:hypothetical protein